MEINEESFDKIKEKAQKLYKINGVSCPYFGFDVILNSDGFHHLQFSARRERSKAEQLLKFTLLPLALKVIRKSGTVQEIREDLISVGKESKDGFRQMKLVTYWAFIAIVGENKKIKIKTIVRRIGDGNIIVWSVMPYSNLKDSQKLYSGDLKDE